MHPLKMHNNPIQTFFGVIYANIHYVLESIAIWFTLAVFHIFGKTVDPHSFIVACMPYIDFIAKFAATIASLYTIYKIHKDLNKKRKN